MVELDGLGGGMLSFTDVGPVALTADAQFLDFSGAVVDPSTIWLGTALTLGVWWTVSGEAEAHTVLVGGGSLEAGLQPLRLGFGGFETLSDGREAIVPQVTEFVLGADALVTLPDAEVGVPFSSLAVEDLLGHAVELSYTVSSSGGVPEVSEVHVYPLEDRPPEGSYLETLLTVYGVDESTYTLLVEGSPFVVDGETVWEDGFGTALDSSWGDELLAEGTRVVFLVDFASGFGRVVRVEVFQEGMDQTSLFESGLPVFSGNFISVVGEEFRWYERRLVASDARYVDELTGDVVVGGLSQVSGLVRARTLHPPLGSPLPRNLLVEIGLNAVEPVEPVDFIDHQSGIVSFVELDAVAGEAQLHLAAIKPVLVDSETTFLDALGNSFDPAALELGEELGIVAWWTSTGDPLAATVFRGGLPLDLSGFAMPFSGLDDLGEGNQVLLGGSNEFDVGADATVAIGQAELPLAEAVSQGELAIGNAVELWLTEVAPGQVEVAEIFVLTDDLPPTDVEPFWDIFGTVQVIDEETYTLVLLNEPFVVDDGTIYDDGLGGELAATELLPGTPLVIQVDFATDRAVRVEIEQEGADYSHLFDGANVDVFFGDFQGFIDDLLVTSDPYRPSVAVDAQIFDEETNENITTTVGLQGLSGEFVRARILHPPPELVIPVDLVVEFGVNVVFDDLEDPVDPTVEGPNANALVSLDLDPEPADQGLVHLQVSAGQNIQLAVYAADVTDVTGVSVDVIYDPVQLAFVDASPNVAGDPNVLPRTAIFLAPRVGEGTIKFTGTELGDVAATGEPRSGLLAVLEFAPLDLRRADLILERVVLNSTGGTDILEPGLVARLVPVATGIADFNGDGFVEWDDLFRFADAWLDDDFDPIFDLNGDGLLDELDLFIFAPQWGQQVGSVAKVKTRQQWPESGVLELDITHTDDELVEMLLRVDEAPVAGYGATVRYDPEAFRLRSVTDARSGATFANRQTSLSLERPGEVLFVGGSLPTAEQGVLARLEFERLSPDATGRFEIVDAALCSADGATVRPLRSDGVEVRSLPQAFSLDRNYPNPFNPSTTIPYRLAVASTVQLEIFDIAGRKVRTVLAETQEAGFRETMWDGRDEDGHVVGAGVYLYRLSAHPLGNDDRGAGGEFVEVRKLMLLK